MSGPEYSGPSLGERDDALLYGGYARRLEPDDETSRVVVGAAQVRRIMFDRQEDYGAEVAAFRSMGELVERRGDEAYSVDDALLLPVETILGIGEDLKRMSDLFLRAGVENNYKEVAYVTDLVDLASNVPRRAAEAAQRNEVRAKLPHNHVVKELAAAAGDTDKEAEILARAQAVGASDRLLGMLLNAAATDLATLAVEKVAPDKLPEYSSRLAVYRQVEQPWSRAIAEGRMTLFVAWIVDKLVARGNLLHAGPREPDIRKLVGRKGVAWLDAGWVNEPWRGAGIGRYMSGYRENYARDELAARRIGLAIEPTNQVQLSLAASRGYEPVTETGSVEPAIFSSQSQFLGEPPRQLIAMVKDL